MDQNFVETIKLLNNNKISYWVCAGTLLGLIRDKQLIPWDHDIDIGIFRKDISKTTLIDLMTNNNYEIIAGERRWRGAQIAGIHEIPAIIKEMDDEDLIYLERES